MLEIHRLLLLAKQYFTPGVILSVTALSAFMAIASLFLIPIVLCKLPDDYFLNEKPHLLTRLKINSPWKSFILVMKNLLGLLLIVAGFLMLFLPGQGILTMIIGVILIDFPRKFELERKIVAKPKILAGINWLRKRRGHSPLKV